MWASLVAVITAPQSLQTCQWFTLSLCQTSFATWATFSPITVLQSLHTRQCCTPSLSKPSFWVWGVVPISVPAIMVASQLLQ